MAEYYPLLAKAVAGLQEPTREARQALYERARNALLNQLRNHQPPVAEADIARETEALENAAARLESELDGQAAAPPPAPAARQSAAPPSAAVKTPSAVRAPAAAPFFAAPRAKAGLPPGRSGEPAPAGAAAPDAGQPALRPAARGDAGLPARSGQAVSPEAAGFNAALAEAGRMPEADAADQPSPSLRFRPEASRPYAPQPREAARQPHMRRLWIVGAVLAICVALIAVAAWKLRDRPEDLVRLKPAAQSQAEPSGGKIAQRVGGAVKTADASASPTAVPVIPETTRAHVEDTAPVPVAQRAALIVEAPDEPNKAKTYVGTVVWRLDNVSNGPGQPLGTAVRADIDIPEAKLKASMLFQKNFDASLSASHTITLIFTPAPDSPVGNVKVIGVPQMRALDTQASDPLGGIPVPIMENSFLIGLSRGSAEAANLSLIRQREWVDIPMAFENDRKAKLTFEKSTTGTRAIEDALAAWKAQ